MKRNSAIYRATSSGLTKYLIGSCITILTLLVSHLSMKCIKRYMLTEKQYVPATDEWGVMDEQNCVKCRNCGVWVYYTSKNTVIYWWPEYLWYSLAQTICEDCGYSQACFLVDNLDWELKWAIEHDLGFIEMQGFPQEDILEAFKQIYPNFVTYHQLSDKEQAWVDYFAYLMEYVPQDEWFNP